MINPAAANDERCAACDKSKWAHIFPIRIRKSLDVCNAFQSKLYTGQTTFQFRKDSNGTPRSCEENQS